MNQHNTFLLTGAFLLATSAAFAQTTFQIGPVLGLNGTTSFIQRDSWKTLPRVGLSAGVQSVIQLGHLAVQPSLRYSQKGWRSKSPDSGNEHIYRLDYLTLPLNFAYSFRSDGQGLQLLAGPYASLLLGGTYRNATGGNARITPNDYQPVPSLGATTYDVAFQRFDAGAQAGVGYRTGKFLAQADVSYGLYDIADWWGSPHNLVAQLSLSYLLYSRE